MSQSVQSLQSNIDQAIRLLDQSPFLSLTKQERDSLRTEATELAEKLASMEGSYLTIGLLGGTGVGKSTLMNALAGSKIASTSHRRPHTDDILIHRHVEANPPHKLPLTDVPWKDFTHQEESIRQILLCDLPDFDSLVGEHTRHVLGFMEHLDVLVWVTSPEKYADGRFYEFLEQVPKAKQNFYFVLNKVDLLFEGDGLEKGYEQMARMASRFQDHIKKSGIDVPTLYTLSSEDALNNDKTAAWNHFPAFRQQIFQQRDVKQIRAIKAANLDVEAQQLFTRLDREILSLQSFQGLLQEAARDLEGQKPQWIQAGREVIHLWLKERIRPEIVSRQHNPSCLLGPGRNLANFVQARSGRFRDEGNTLPRAAPFAPPEEITDTFKRRFEWIVDRLHHHILRDNLPKPFQALVQEKLDAPKGIEELKERFSSIVASTLGRRILSSTWRFKTLQFLTYVFLLIFLLFAIGGETAWRGVFENPGGRSVLDLALSVIQTLFSAKGLAALGSYVVLNFLFALRFYNRYRRLRENAAEKVIDSLKVDLGNVWDEQLGKTVRQLNQLEQDIQGRISAIANLR